MSAQLTSSVPSPGTLLPFDEELMKVESWRALSYEEQVAKLIENVHARAAEAWYEEQDEDEDASAGAIPEHAERIDAGDQANGHEQADNTNGE